MQLFRHLLIIEPLADHSERPLLFLGVEHRLSAKLLALRHSGFHTRLGSRCRDLAFQLSAQPKDAKNELPHDGREIKAFLHTVELSPFGADSRHVVVEPLHRPVEPIDPPHDKLVAFAQTFDREVELWAILGSAGTLLAINDAAALTLERLDLKIKDLLFGADSCISNFCLVALWIYDGRKFYSSH